MKKEQVSLRDQAIKVLHENRGDWRRIAEETGLGYDWLSKLSQGKIPDPGVTKIERLMAWSQGRAA